METTIGGDRLGSGNKQQISFKNYERSTHDLSYLWRSTIAPGTLVPFMSKVALPGDTWDIKLNTEVLTLPTVGPLFGSYKVQLDVFEVPMRLYNAKLHMNKLGIGMDMSQILLPQIELKANNHASYVKTYDDNEHVNPSSLLKYLGISGLGAIKGSTNPAKRKFNAIPLLAYWDIYKNYYSNKQEEIGMYIHTPGNITGVSMTPIACTLYRDDEEYDILGDANVKEVLTSDFIKIQFPENAVEPDPTGQGWWTDDSQVTFSSRCENVSWIEQEKVLVGYVKSTYNQTDMYCRIVPWSSLESVISDFGVHQFKLSNIDDMRESILQYASASAFVINQDTPAPYGTFMHEIGTNQTLKYCLQESQEGLGLKTYQSDLFNNWINTEWIDGENGVSELSKVIVQSGSEQGGNDSFTIDALNIAQKVYTMLNRIAVSGGTYDDWLDAVYTHERVKSVESPIYMGSLIKELAFQEVISNTATEDQPLGTLAGRGVLTNKHKGGYINIKVNEPSYIIGIISITPRIEYSQGNDWDVNLKSFDDLHKPALDAIGFQDLITEQLLWTDTDLDSSTETLTTKSLGKQPAWVNYMSNVNKCYGNFAKESDSMFMTLNRRYSKANNGQLNDATTYIDPTKYNQIFAETALDAQNFWAQISVDITARRKMSAKLIPNL